MTSWNPDQYRRLIDEATRMRTFARKMREQARRARGGAALMQARNTERRVRMGQLLYRLYHLSTRAHTPRGLEPEA